MTPERAPAPLLRISGAGDAGPPDGLRARAEGKDLAGDLSALCDGAAMLSRAGNRVAALALLWAAVGLDPLDLAAHRRLAATLANVGDADAAADEYVRYIEFVLKLGDAHRAAIELGYARVTLGGHPLLDEVGQRLVPLGAMVPLEPFPVERVARAPEAQPHREARTTHVPRSFVAAGILAHLSFRARTVGEVTAVGGIVVAALSIVAIGALLAFGAVRPF